MTDLAHLFDAPESLALYRVKRERDQLRQLLDRLDAYVGHWENCSTGSDAPDCDCGLDDLYTRARALVRGEQS